MTSAPVFTGRLEPFFETGTEGIVWSVLVDGLLGYDALLPLENGDELVIYGQDGTVAWQGVIALEYKRRQRPYPMNPQYSQQEVLGRWVNGLQEGVDPEVWAQAFFQQAPAVVRPGPRAYSRDWPGQEALLHLLAHDPVAALAHARALQPKTDWKASIAWALEYVTKEMRWKKAMPLNTDEQQAHAWRLYLALQRADRAAWIPSKDPAYARVAERWPTPAALTPADIEHWAQHRLPQDSFYG